MALWVPFALIAVGLLAIYVEIFVPAAGLIGLSGGGMIVASVVIAFVEHGVTTGSIVLITALVATPTAVVIGLKLFPSTRVGKRLILGDPAGVATEADARKSGNNESAPAHTEVSAGNPVAGAVGEALTDLRPSGAARFDRVKMSVITRGEYVERGHAIRVVRVEGNRIVVAEA